MTTPSASPAAPPNSAVQQITLRIFLSFVAGYFMSYALRSVKATLAPLLAQDLGLSASSLGWLSAAYFLSFASVQWFIGTWLDRYGARRTESVLLCMAAAGAVIMAISETLWGLSLVEF